MRSLGLVHVVAGLATLGLAGCDHVLAKNNPCGGIYPADGVAEVRAQADGTLLDADGKTYPFELTSGIAQESGPDGACWTFVSGTATDTGGETIDLQVECGSVVIDVTLPDVRLLDHGATARVPVKVGPSPQGATICTGTATLAIETATGAKAPAPSWVTSDFVRAGTLHFEPATPPSGDASVDAAAATDAGGGSGVCPIHVALDAHVEVNASDYSQATTSGDDHCPKLPDK